ncbi:MAG: PDDEXK nuclease domain-containing protein [bacterium]|nr:PDDEXK nuclease domain-containing protein [bacterium]
MAKELITTKQQLKTVEGYNEILRDIRSLLEKATYQAYKAVDNLRVQTYWQVGERVVRGELEHRDRADYGKRVITNLALDLGLTKVILHYMVKFYKTYPIVQTVSEQLTWSHIVELIYIDDNQARQFYEIQIVQNNWSVRELRRQIKSNLYQKTLKEGKLSIIRPIPLRPLLPEQVFKDTYNFDFLQLQNGHSEKQLEEGLLANVERLLLEFGSDFSLAGRQHKIMIGHEIHAIDLEFYHRGIPCIILVDLKIGKFKGEYVGQMNKYLNYYRENKVYPWEKSPVGLIVCEYKGKEEAHYALGNLENKIFVAEYKAKLPGEEEIERGVRNIRNADLKEREKERG